MSDPDIDVAYTTYRREMRWDGYTLSSVVVINHEDYEILCEEKDAEAE